MPNYAFGDAIYHILAPTSCLIVHSWIFEILKNYLKNIRTHVKWPFNSKTESNGTLIDLLFGSFECLHTPIADQSVRVLITHMYYISLNRNLTDCDQRLSNKWCQWSQSSNKGACWNLYSSDILCSTSVDHFKPPSLCEPLSFFGNLKDGLQGA